jgi:membrane protein implicated in regulation of membrane protease activity
MGIPKGKSLWVATAALLLAASLIVGATYVLQSEPVIVPAGTELSVRLTQSLSSKPTSRAMISPASSTTTLWSARRWSSRRVPRLPAK